MNELIFEITDMHPAEFLGSQNTYLNQIKKHFPKIKIVARGNKITAYGDEDSLDMLDQKFASLKAHYGRFNRLDQNAVEQILTHDGYAAEKAFSKDDPTIVHGVNGRIVKAETENQWRLVEEIEKNDLVFAVGPAGTGKTYTGVALAVKALKEKQVKRIILTRPAVEAGEKLGFLPGDMKEKLDPYMQPLYDALRDMIPVERLDNYMERGIVQIVPMAYMRGRTLDNAFVILDEAQNTTHAQMKMFLTRMGKHAKFMLTGDIEQIDLPRRVVSGMKEALVILKGVPGVSIVVLDGKDVIRHPLVKKVITAYKTIENTQS